MTSSRSNSATPRVVLVTGGSRGIGRASVEALADDGFTVHFCSRSPGSVREAQEALRQRFGEKVTGEAVDVRRQEEVDGWVGGVREREGRIDCLVNNAGLGHFGPVTELTGDQWREVLETNLNGAFYVLRAAARVMVEQGRGWIFNIASLAGKNPFAGGAAYNASKFGLVGMSEAAMLDLRQSGVRVAAILPGSVDTAFHTRDGSSWMMQPEDVAQMILDLLRFPERTLPSLVEMRPTRPPKK
jgi:NAD(P)-dependent dehydrogenase (short-subunit alcohol dehydrogenase family)